MNKTGNHLHAETERKLRDALLEYMEAGREPTIGQLCDRAEINRSTFYRHYTDLYDLMSHVEMEFQHGLYQSLGGGGAFLSGLSTDPKVLEIMISYIGRNAPFYRVYLQKYAGMTSEKSFPEYWQGQVRPLFETYGVSRETHMRYYYSYVQAGLITVLRTWLENGCVESPRDLADMLRKMLPVRPDLP